VPAERGRGRAERDERADPHERVRPRVEPGLAHVLDLPADDPLDHPRVALGELVQELLALVAHLVLRSGRGRVQRSLTAQGCRWITRTG
jgi:hypothetical protein